MLLLDEITVDLDVLGRADLLRFLRQETESRNATVVYVRACSHLHSPGFCNVLPEQGAGRRARICWGDLGCMRANSHGH